MRSAETRLLRGMVLAVMALAVARAAAAEITYHKTFEEARAAAKENRQFIMVIVTTAQSPHDKKFRDETLASEPVVKLIRRYFAAVFVDVAEVSAGKQKLPEPVKAEYVEGNQIKLPIPCAIIYDQTGKQKKKLVNLIVDQKGTKKWFDVIPGAMAPEQFHRLLKTVSEDAAKLTPPKKLRDVARAMRLGREAYQRKDYRTAFASFKAIVDAGMPGDELDQAERLLAQIEEKAVVPLEDGKANEIEEKLGSAIRSYRRCLRTFQGTAAAAEAEKRLGALRDDPELRKRLHNHMAGQLLSRAEAAMKAGRYGDAAEHLDVVVERYTAADDHAKAKELRAELDSDPKIKAEVAERKARVDAQRLLRLADGYRRNKMAEKALATYKQIAERYPGTRYAKQAEERIAELRAQLGS